MGQLVSVSAVGEQDGCDCPACSGPPASLSELVDEVLEDVPDDVEPVDPLSVEFGAAMFVATCALSGEGYEDALADVFVPEFESRASSAALLLLLALGSVCDGRAGDAASDAARRMVGSGVELPAGAAELNEALSVGECLRLGISDGSGAVLISTFHRAGQGHAFLVIVDNTECGEAVNIELFDADGLSEVVESLRRTEVGVSEERLEPAEWRWQVECALDVRADHDGGSPRLDEERLPDYYPLAALLRARLRDLPESDRPRPEHEAPLAPPLPPAPAGPAPVYRLKVGLAGAKPPIWRRLEIPADVDLERLHLIIQVSFGWDGSHLHVFETPYGEFGIDDPELGHRPAAGVTLAQVLPGERTKITYLYDFGDDWRHQILVEKVLDPDESVTYPRCTGGRRAAPPEDCGGIWGYGDLLDVLADPAHPDHASSLEWLGLDSATDFDPTAFDASAITSALASLETVTERH